MASAKVLDFSFMEIVDMRTELQEKIDFARPPANPEDMIKKDDEERPARTVTANSLRLNNNAIEDLSQLTEGVESVLKNPMGLRWADLSGNEISEIPEGLGVFPDLNVLYLHGNKIESLKELKKLAECTSLRSVTLHGNPLEDDQKWGHYYRLYLIHKMPNLTKIDFTGVTRQDRDTAKTWAQTHRKQLGKLL